MDIQLSSKATAADRMAAEELRAADPAKIYTYTTYDVCLPYRNHYFDKVIDDSAAYFGKTIELRADIRRKKDPNSKEHLNLTESGMKLYVVDVFNNDPDVATIPFDQLIADGEYHLYKFQNVVIVSDKSPRFLTLFKDWGFQVTELPSELAHKPNTPVDLYLSMKITGDLTFRDPENLPVYYIDRIIVVGPAREEVPVRLEDAEPLKLPEINIGKDALNLAKMKVVLPRTATAVEKNAAKELVDYVKKMTGKVIETVTEGQTVASGIYIGDTEFAKANQVTHPTTEYGEGWAIKAVEGNLVLCGDTVRGTLYAVYHLLENVLGIHWWTYTEESVPTGEALVPADIDHKGAPAFKYRDMHPGALCHTENMFQVRNRLNGWEAIAPAGFGGQELFGSPVYVHSFAHYVPDSMFSEHPEWFSLIDGERKPSSQLCMTNPELLDYMKKQILRYIEEDIAKAEATGTSRPRWYSLCPNDIEGFCECEACREAIKKGGVSGYLLKFVNEIAAVVEEKHPEVLVDTLAYWQYRNPPLDDTKPADNVQVRFAYSNMDVLHSFAHPNNAGTVNAMKEWAAITPKDRFFVWDYLVNYGVNGISPTMYKHPSHLKTMLEIGATGYFGEQEDPINTDFWDLKMWLNAKMLEDPYQDFDLLMNTFLNGYYGAAAPYLRKYLDLVGALLEKSHMFALYGDPTNSPRWLTLDAVLVSYQYFEKAFAAVAGDETLLTRLRLARNCLDRVVAIRYNFYKDDAAATGKTFNIDKKELCIRIIDCLKEQIALRGHTDYVAEKNVLPYFEDILDNLD